MSLILNWPITNAHHNIAKLTLWASQVKKYILRNSPFQPLEKFSSNRWWMIVKNKKV